MFQESPEGAGGARGLRPGGVHSEKFFCCFFIFLPSESVVILLLFSVSSESFYHLNTFTTECFIHNLLIINILVRFSLGKSS